MMQFGMLSLLAIPAPGQSEKPGELHGESQGRMERRLREQRRAEALVGLA